MRYIPIYALLLAVLALSGCAAQVGVPGVAVGVDLGVHGYAPGYWHGGWAHHGWHR